MTDPLESLDSLLQRLRRGSAQLQRGRPAPAVSVQQQQSAPSQGILSSSYQRTTHQSLFHQQLEQRWGPVQQQQPPSQDQQGGPARTDAAIALELQLSEVDLRSAFQTDAAIALELQLSESGSSGLRSSGEIEIGVQRVGTRDIGVQAGGMGEVEIGVQRVGTREIGVQVDMDRVEEEVGVERTEEVDRVPRVECSICLETIQDYCCNTTCGHTFHRQCIEQWLFDNNSCPVCREGLSTQGLL